MAVVGYGSLAEELGLFLQRLLDDSGWRLDGKGLRRYGVDKKGHSFWSARKWHFSDEVSHFLCLIMSH